MKQNLVVRRMRTGELPSVIDVWYRSLIDSLHWLRPEQRRSERGFAAYHYGRSPAPEDEPDVWYAWRGDPAG